LGLKLQVFQSLLQPPLQDIGPLARLAGVEPGVGFAGRLLELQLLGTVVPVSDLLGEAILDRRLGLGDEVQLAAFDLGKVLRHDLGDGVTLRLFLQFAVDPLALWPIKDGVDTGLVRRQGAVVEIGGVREVRKQE
jgi:hypothetical protein